MVGGIGAALDDDGGKPETKPSASAKPETAVAGPDGKPGVPSRETWEYVASAHRTAFVAYLRALDPGLTPTSPGARARPLRRAVNVCLDIHQGKPDATVLHNTAYRYNGGQASVPQGSQKARRILAAVKRWICADPGLRAHFAKTHERAG
ncbi:hypothetical protein GEV43_27240 [Actinomadura sp. J1-007]|nr:hypothetical protein [Actinomadura sp. J1-007]